MTRCIRKQLFAATTVTVVESESNLNESKLYFLYRIDVCGLFAITPVDYPVLKETSLLQKHIDFEDFECNSSVRHIPQNFGKLNQ